jgi:hypothetical protein
VQVLSIISRTDDATFPVEAKTGNNDAASPENGDKIVSTQDQRRNTMHSMNASYFIEKVGHGVMNAFLLAALPTALVATLIQAL